MPIKVTVQDFVDRFKELNIKPVSGRWGIDVSNGVIVTKNQGQDACACGLGVMVLGKEVNDFFPTLDVDAMDDEAAVNVVERWASSNGIDVESFITGYDKVMLYDQETHSKESFDFGFAVRVAVGL